MHYRVRARDRKRARKRRIRNKIVFVDTIPFRILCKTEMANLKFIQQYFDLTAFWMCRCKIKSIQRAFSSEKSQESYSKCETKVHIINDISNGSITVWKFMHGFWKWFELACLFSVLRFFLSLSLSDIMSVILSINLSYTTRSLLKEHSNLCRMMRN